MRVTQAEVTFLESRPVSMKKEAMHGLAVKKEAMHARTHVSDISENPTDSGSQNCIEYYLPTPTASEAAMQACQGILAAAG